MYSQTTCIFLRQLPGLFYRYGVPLTNILLFFLEMAIDERELFRGLHGLEEEYDLIGESIVVVVSQKSITFC